MTRAHSKAEFCRHLHRADGALCPLRQALCDTKECGRIRAAQAQQRAACARGWTATLPIHGCVRLVHEHQDSQRGQSPAQQQVDCNLEGCYTHAQPPVIWLT